MDQQSTASVDLTGVRRSVKIGFLFTAAIMALASITGCGATHLGAAAQAHANVDGPVIAGKRLPNVVFIGDSITINWVAPWAGTSFTQHTNWINKGVVGNNSNQVLARFQTDVIDLYPDIVVILVGTNDVYPGWTLGPSEVPAVFLNAIDSPANVEAMVEMARANYVQVILATIPPWNCDANNCAYSESIDPTLGRYANIDIWNEWLKQYAFSKSITVVDYHAALYDPSNNMYVPDRTVDGIHPAVPGYELMGPLVSQAIDQVWANYQDK
jgi:lysophospholipase L1-like esterase